MRLLHRFAALAVIAVLALGLAGCGDDNGKKSSGKATAKAASDYDKQLKYAQCMRSSGIDMPDPDPNGGPMRMLRKNKGEADEKKFEAAQQKCRVHLPNGGKPQKLSAADLAKMRDFAKCMREHGVDMPDPSDDGSIMLKKRAGSGGGGAKGPKEGPESKEFQAAEKACESLRPLRPGGGK